MGSAINKALYLGDFVRLSYSLLSNKNGNGWNFSGSHYSPEVQEFLMAFRPLWKSAARLIGKTLYELSHDCQNLGKEAADAGSKILLWGELIDTAIDQPGKAIEEKEQFLDRVVEKIASGAEIAPENSSKDNKLLVQAVDQLGTDVYGLTWSGTHPPRLVGSLTSLVAASKEQFRSKSIQGQLRVLEEIGGGYLGSCAFAIEAVAGREFPGLRKCAEALGKYAQALDGYTDLKSDLAEGTTTYFTARFAELISHHSENEAMKILKYRTNGLTASYLQEGAAHMRDAADIRKYSALARLISLKYAKESVQNRLYFTK